MDYNERFSDKSSIKEYKSTLLLSDENKKYAGVLIFIFNILSWFGIFWFRSF